MSGLQTIINNCQSLEIDRRKVIGSQITRNEVVRTSVTPTFQPWRFRVTMPSRFRYSEARALLESLDTLDRSVPQVVTFGDVDCLSWMFRYQGAANPAQLQEVTVQSFVGKSLTLTNLPAIPATAPLFRPNDLIQIGNKPHPFTSEQEVLRGTGTTVTVSTHRPNILTGNIIGDTIRVGNSCEFNLLCLNMPTYRLNPGGFLKDRFGRTINNALIEFSDEFVLHEFVATA